MKINIKKCLEFFDERNPEHQGHTNAVIGMIGEEIASKTFLHYMSSRKRRIEIIEDKFQATGHRNGAGPRLDAWFIELNEKKLYQCEIKNWCSWATTGIDVGESPEKVMGASQYYWDVVKKEFAMTKKYGKTSKVLVEMNKPKNYTKFKLEPLLILWWPISPNNKLEPLFSVDVRSLNIRFKTRFKKLHIFSVSLYLRELLNRKKDLTLDMPDSQYRIKTLKNLGIL